MKNVQHINGENCILPEFVTLNSTLIACRSACCLLCMACSTVFMASLFGLQYFCSISTTYSMYCIKHLSRTNSGSKPV